MICSPRARVRIKEARITLDTALLEFEVLTTCPICGHDDIPPLIHIRDLGIDSAYCNCQGCGQLFLNPRMSDEATVQYYAGMYRTSLTERIPDFMAKDTRLQQERSAAQLPFILALFGKSKIRPNILKVIDIGCSLGYLLDELSYDDTECEGVEPDTRYHSYYPANRFPMYASVGDIPMGKTYDLITLSHSLEHINHPRQLLDDLLAKHAHEDTIIMVDVPNTEMHRGSYRIHHPMAFTPFTLTGLFERICWRLMSMHFYGLEHEGPGKKYMIGFYQRMTK